MNIGHDYPARVREGESVFSLEAFQTVTRAVERHDLLGEWHKKRLIQISPFYSQEKNESPAIGLLRMVEEAKRYGGVRIVVGDVYIDEPIADFPSERLIATIALLLQARGEL